MSSLLQSKNYIDGNWVNSSKEQYFEVTNPANGEFVGFVPDMTVDDGQKAIEAAKQALYNPEWSNMTGKRRSELLKNWYELIEQHRNEIASIMTAESGKPINESQGELTYGNLFIEWFAEEAKRMYGEIVSAALPNRKIMILRQPIGVAALITPWNFPFAVITRKTAAALAAGCTVVIKPSEDTPLTALALTKLAEEAGFPTGTINIITTKETAPILDLFCSNPDVSTISFTGSTQIGKLLYRNCTDPVKRLSLELGGSAPFIVFESADLEKAVEGAMISKFRNCGQTCVSANRFFVHEKIYDSFVKDLTNRVKKLKIGNGNFSDTQIGPLINKMQFKKVKALVHDAVNKGAKVIYGGKPLPEIGVLFYQPTVIDNVSVDAKLYNKGVFGPVVTIIKFTSEEEVIAKANNTRRGLVGYFYSQDMAQIFRVAKKLEVGMVGANEGLISTAEDPFAVVKESGIGRESSQYGIDEYVEIKYVCLGNLKY